MTKLIPILLLQAALAFGQAPTKIPLYPVGKPVMIQGFDKEPPFMDYYPSAVANRSGQAVLICPGGGYMFLALQHEGSDVAKFFNQHGFDAFVLHYRINDGKQGGHRFPDQFNDVTMAMRVIRAKSTELKIDPARVGVLGFSAGGHLASMLGTMHLPPNPKIEGEAGKYGTRPAFMVLIYPVISLTKYAHKGSATMLLGPNASEAKLDSLSTHNRVTTETPPTFLVYSNDDDVVVPENGTLMYEALRKAKVPVALHIYEYGGHGFGMAPKDPTLNGWTNLMLMWLERLGYQTK